MIDYEYYAKKLYKISCKTDAIYHKQALAFGISDTENILLYIIGEGLASTQKEIIDIWGMPKTTLNSAVKKLQRKGLMYFDGKKGKEKELSLTQEGIALAHKVNMQSNNAEHKAMMETEKFIKTMGLTLDDLLSICICYTDNINRELEKALETIDE